MKNSPIADLSYRHYDGPLNGGATRWWSIAKLSIQLAMKKKGFWVWAVLSGYWYYILLAVFWFVESFIPSPVPGKHPLLSAIIWKDQFSNAFNISQLLLFVIALLIGTGTIANDNRANALLVYLSKPCTKLDYIIGKWMGVFIPITIVSLIPTLFFFAYGGLSFQEYGFISDWWLLPKLVLICCLPGALHASLCIGISSLFNQGRIAGAVYSGLFFLPWFFTKAMQVVYVVLSNNDNPKGKASLKFVGNLYYASMDGIQIGVSKAILNTGGSALFPGGGSPRGTQFVPIPPPNGTAITVIFIAICVIFSGIAWLRVRAVEVV